MPEAHTRRAQVVRRGSDPRRDPEDKRQRILSAATLLLGEEGYEAMTVARVAAMAGVSEGLLFHHFGSKRGILTALADSCGQGAFEAVFGAFAEGTPTSSEGVLRPLFDYARENRPLVRALATLAAAEDRNLAVGAVRSRVVAGLTDFLVRQEDLALVRPMAPALLAELLFSMVMTALTECFVNGDGSDEAAWLGELCRCVDAAVAGPAELGQAARRNG